jgi:hypothetical protein
MQDHFTSSSLAPSSKQLFNNKIHKWLSFFPIASRDIIFLIMFPSKSTKYLSSGLTESENTATNIHMYISAICALFKHSPVTSSLPDKDTLSAKWISLQKINSAQLERRKDTHAPTDLQLVKSGSHLSLQQIIESRDALTDGSIERLLISMYTLIPPVRADFFATQIVRPGETPISSNYLILKPDSAALILNDFKTSASYHQIKHESLPTSLFNQIKLSLALHPRQFLFVNADGNPYTRNAFTAWANRTFSRVLSADFSLTLLRHIYISSLTDIAITDLDRIGKQMGHSLQMQHVYSWKV